MGWWGGVDRLSFGDKISSPESADIRYTCCRHVSPDLGTVVMPFDPNDVMSSDSDLDAAAPPGDDSEGQSVPNGVTVPKLLAPPPIVLAVSDGGSPALRVRTGQRQDSHNGSTRTDSGRSAGVPRKRVSAATASTVPRLSMVGAAELGDDNGTERRVARRSMIKSRLSTESRKVLPPPEGRVGSFIAGSAPPMMVRSASHHSYRTRLTATESASRRSFSFSDSDSDSDFSDSSSSSSSSVDADAAAQAAAQGWCRCTVLGGEGRVSENGVCGDSLCGVPWVC